MLRQIVRKLSAWAWTDERQAHAFASKLSDMQRAENNRLRADNDLLRASRDRLFDPPLRAFPDGSPPEIVLANLVECARGFAPGVRVVGNIRACDLIRAAEWALATIKDQAGRVFELCAAQRKHKPAQSHGGSDE